MLKPPMPSVGILFNFNVDNILENAIFRIVNHL